MPESQDVARRISTITNFALGAADSNMTLRKVIVNKATATAVINVYDGQSSAGTQIASIDGNVVGSKEYNVRCKNGIFVDQITAAADVTVTYF